LAGRFFFGGVKTRKTLTQHAAALKLQNNFPSLIPGASDINDTPKKDFAKELALSAGKCNNRFYKARHP